MDVYGEVFLFKKMKDLRYEAWMKRVMSNSELRAS